MKSFPLRIYLIALVLRLIPILLTRGLGIGLDDMFQYDMLARSLASGHGFRWYAQEDLKLLEPYVDFDLSTATGYDPQYGLYTSFRAPLYPTFLAIVYFFSGLDFSRFFAARLAQVIFLGAPLAPLTYLTAKHLSSFLFHFKRKEERGKRAEKAARLSAWIVAYYPMLLVYPLGLGTENPFFVLLLSSFLFLLKSIERPSNSNLLLSGLFLALTALTRSVILPFAGLAILFLIVIARSRFAATKQSPIPQQGLLRREKYPPRNDGITIGIVFMLVIAPWVIRNSLLHRKLTGIETSMGYNLYLGYHPHGNGSFIFGPSLDLLTIMDDAERDEVGIQKALGFIAEQPGRFLPLALNRLGFFFGLDKRVLMYFYSNNIIGYIPKPALLTISAVLLLPFVFISTSAVFGLSLLPRNRHSFLVILLLITYIFPHVFILAEDRFHLALVPYFAILAAYCWQNGFQGISARWRESVHGKLAVIFAILGVILLLANWGFELSRDADKIAALLGPNGNQSHFPY